MKTVMTLTEIESKRNHNGDTVAMIGHLPVNGEYFAVFVDMIRRCDLLGTFETWNSAITQYDNLITPAQILGFTDSLVCWDDGYSTNRFMAASLAKLSL